MKFNGWLSELVSAACCTCALGLVLSISLTRPAHAAPPVETVADMQCVVVGVRLAGSADQHQGLSGTMLAIYFLGRIDGRSPTVDLQQLLVEEVKNMSDAALKVAATRCGAELSRRGVEITRIGQKVEALGKSGAGG